MCCRFGRSLSRLRLSGALIAVLTGLTAQTAFAQFGAVGGVYVDPEGMLRETSSLAESDLKQKLAAPAGEKQPSAQVSAPSPLRKVSLRRLEQEVARRHAAGEPLSADLRYMAGLNAVKFVFIDADQADVILAGPAGGWDVLPTGDIVSLPSKRPVLQLDDLIVALRYGFADHAPGAFFGCSIEPTEQGMKAHAAHVRGLANIDASQMPQILRRMERAMGPQDIHVYGVPGASRFALEMIAADYRLKRISLSHDPSPSTNVPGYLDLAERAVTGGPQRQHRWWFVGHYDAIRHTADRLAYEFEGTGLKVETAPTQLKPPRGQVAPKPTRAAKMFAELATKNLPELCEKVPPFAELQNLVALGVAAALVRRQSDVPPGVGPVAGGRDEPAEESTEENRWRPTHFLDEAECPIAGFETPKQTPALANARFVKDRFWMFSVSGGVEINPRLLIDEEHLKPAAGEKLAAARDKSKPPKDEARWWWD